MSVLPYIMNTHWAVCKFNAARQDSWPGFADEFWSASRPFKIAQRGQSVVIGAWVGAWVCPTHPSWHGAHMYACPQMSGFQAQR